MSKRAERERATHDRYVVPNEERGGWDVVRDGHRRATAHADTEAQAVARARQLTSREGGGEVRVLNRAGKIGSTKTVKRRAA